MSKKEIRIGIVGCGFITQGVHLPAFRHCKGANVVAVCDISAEAAKKVAQKFGVPNYYSNVTEMLKKEHLDVVDVCTSISSHAQIATQAMEAGCDVLSEKPMAANTKQAEDEVAVSQKTGKKLCVIQNQRFQPVVMKMKKIIATGALGDIMRTEVKESCPPWDYPPIADPKHWWHKLPGGVFGDMLPHPLYMSKEFMGDIESVEVKKFKLGPYAHLPVDEVQLILKCKRGVATTITSCNWPSIHHVDVYGSKKCLHVDLKNSFIVLYTGKTNNGQGIPMLYLRQNLSRCFQILNGTIEVGMKWLVGQHTGHRMQIKLFVESVQNNTPPPVTGEDDLKITKLLEEITNQL
jgi:predicted dehydrogenase